jgi:predicted transcriptional regulator
MFIIAIRGDYLKDKSFSHSLRRNKFEIWAEVLESCLNTPRTQSWLLLHLRLKTSAIKKALEFLLSAQLIELIDPFQSVNNTKKYRTTVKGEEALTHYYQLLTKFSIQE